MNIRVAVVEDETAVREMLRTLLDGSPGFACTAVYESAEAALSAVNDITADVMLVDIHLPGQTGIELISKLKPGLPRTQFMIYTSYEDSDHIFSALKSGATGYITKHTQPAVLLQSIADIHNGGAPMNSHIARKVISSFQTTTAADTQHALTARELEILSLAGEGYRYKDIGERLFISTDTVRAHIRNIYEKLQVNSRVKALNKVFPKKG